MHENPPWWSAGPGRRPKLHGDGDAEVKRNGVSRSILSESRQRQPLVFPGDFPGRFPRPFREDFPVRGIWFEKYEAAGADFARGP